MKIALKDKILGQIKEAFEIEETIDADTSLIQDGIMNSLQFVEFLFDLVSIYSFEIDLNDLELEELESAQKLANYINKVNGIDDMTLRELFESICEQRKDDVVLIFDEEDISYTKLLNTVISVARGFLHNGITKNTTVAIVLPNCIEYIYTYFALLYIGAWPVPINTRWTSSDLYNVLENSKARFVVCTKRVGNIPYGNYIADFNSFEIEKVFYIGDNIYGNKGIDFNELICNLFDELLEDNIQGVDPAMLSYTSGTTGNPKGVILKNNDLVKISLISAEYWWDDTDLSMSIAPLYAAQGFLSVFINFASGRPFKMLSTFNPNDILNEVSKTKNTILHTQPTMWSMLLNSRLINFADFSNLKKLIVSGSLCSPELAKRIEDKIGCILMNAYGLIEGTSVVTMTRLEDPEDVRYNTVGKPIPGVEIKIVDCNRNEIPKGEIGELAIRGYIMGGYYAALEKTAEVIDSEGWLYTGDLANYYDDENISIVGRCKDMIIRGGFNVYPSDIEEYVLQMENVQTAAVVGKQHEILGEEIIAYVVPVAGKALADKDVIKFLKNKIANYKLPDQVVIISEMPIVLAGKIDKKILLDWGKNGTPTDKIILFENK